MDKNQLASIREDILKDVMPLALDNTQNGADKFELLMRLIQAGNASGELYQRAYENAKSIEDGNDRMQALLSLLDEIDVDINNQNQINPPSVQQPPEAASMVPSDQTIPPQADNDGQGVA